MEGRQGNQQSGDAQAGTGPGYSPCGPHRQKRWPPTQQEPSSHPLGLTLKTDKALEGSTQPPAAGSARCKHTFGPGPRILKRGVDLGKENNKEGILRRKRIKRTGRIPGESVVYTDGAFMHSGGACGAVQRRRCGSLWVGEVHTRGAVTAPYTCSSAPSREQGGALPSDRPTAGGKI